MYIYTHVRSPLSITAFRFLKRDFRHAIVRAIPFETLNYVTSVLYFILDLTLEGKNSTIERISLPALVAEIPRAIFDTRSNCVSAAK